MFNFTIDVDEANCDSTIRVLQITREDFCLMFVLLSPLGNVKLKDDSLIIILYTGVSVSLQEGCLDVGTGLGIGTGLGNFGPITR